MGAEGAPSIAWSGLKKMRLFNVIHVHRYIEIYEIRQNNTTNLKKETRKRKGKQKD